MSASCVHTFRPETARVWVWRSRTSFTTYLFIFSPFHIRKYTYGPVYARKTSYPPLMAALTRLRQYSWKCQLIIYVCGQYHALALPCKNVKTKLSWKSSSIPFRSVCLDQFIEDWENYVIWAPNFIQFYFMYKLELFLNHVLVIGLNLMNTPSNHKWQFGSHRNFFVIRPF